ncbi:MAG TPA: hypothetical protein PKX91_06130 [Clostridia bacterium]|jgi:hypothetical protein|nr:hypothetical protein [Clostridia bacterium]
MKNNIPRYTVMEFNQLEKEQLSLDGNVLTLLKNYMDKTAYIGLKNDYYKQVN